MNMARWKTRLNRFKHILSSQLFNSELTYYAAALSFYSLFAIIPLLWVLFAVFSKMPLFAQYYEEMKNLVVGFVVPGHSQQVDSLLDSFLNNSTEMGWLGLIYVLLTSVLFFSNFSDVVNRLFHVNNRRLFRSMLGFVALMIMMPFLLGASIFISSQLTVYFQLVAELSWQSQLYSYLLLCLLFYSIFKFSPNTRVGAMPALLSALVTASLWQAAKLGFLYYVELNQTYATIYGSFSLVLFALLWIYLSWLLCLYGLKFCYHLQYNQTHRLSQINHPVKSPVNESARIPCIKIEKK